MKRLVLGLATLALWGQNPLAERITAAALRGHVSFLASDVLEGRATPSRGLDVAAAYIESEFRSANLESPANGEYAQIADYIEVTDYPETVLFSVAGGGREGARVLSGDRVHVESSRAIHLVGAPIFKWAPNVKVEGTLAGMVLMLRMPQDRSVVGKLAMAKPSAIVLLQRNFQAEKSTPRLIVSEKDFNTGPVILTVPEAEVEGAFDRLSNGATGSKANVTIGSPSVRPARLRNVVGTLRGSDPKLREQALVISAHYDHLGIASEGKDRIYNGANDNASGVATVIELARAFARENPRPKRTLVFVCFFGEEEGLLGSSWYVKHPVFPLANTVADINFEQLGETANNEGLPAGSLGVTGYAISDLPELVTPGLNEAGVELREVRHNEEYFERSDNLTFAKCGIPAHTFVAALEYPDYHRVTDEWPKLNYENMAKLDRGLALAILHLANHPEPPHWTEGNRNAKEYLGAWHRLHP